MTSNPTALTETMKLVRRINEALDANAIMPMEPLPVDPEPVLLTYPLGPDGGYQWVSESYAGTEWFPTGKPREGIARSFGLKVTVEVTWTDELDHEDPSPRNLTPDELVDPFTVLLLD